MPKVASGYQLALGISLLYFTVLATAWALFSGPTHYISLATVAFFGIGAYTVAVRGEFMPWPAVLAIAGLIGIAVALVVGLSTLRLSGIYFVIFTFGLSELIRQIVSWYEININRSVGRYIFLTITTEQIYWQLLALVAIVLLAGWLIGRSRLGLALRVIGNDEVVARHAGIDTTLAKLAMFAIERAVHDADRRRDGAALDLHRSRDRVLAAALVRGGHHGAARRRRHRCSGRCSAPCRWCSCSRCSVRTSRAISRSCSASCSSSSCTCCRAA